jgi:hypothetical protein
VRSFFTLLALSLFLASPARAATVFVPTKDYAWQWGEPPAEFQDFKKGGYRVRDWLESLGAPKLEEAPRALKKEVLRYFDLEKPTAVRYAVLGPPRSTSGHDPYCYVWVEWVTKNKFFFDLDEHRFERHAGVARIAIEGAGERKVDIREWTWEKDLKSAQLDKVVPWDAAVVARKMLNLHAFRPRVKPERANGEGRDAAY